MFSLFKKKYHSSLFCLLLIYLMLSACSHTSPSFPKDEEILCEAFNPILKKNNKPKNFDINPWNASLKAQLRQKLIDYKEGKVGMKVKNLRLAGLTAEKIHQKLLNEGFVHKRIPLLVDPRIEPPLYWNKDGSVSKNLPSVERYLPMDIYANEDGSVVRSKAWGIPDKEQKTIRPQPHLSKSVLFDHKQKCFLFFFNCHYKLSWQNEAFKVSEKGIPLPKSAKKEDGIRIFSQEDKEKKEIFISSIMEEAHMDLPINWDHCRSSF